MYAQTKATVTRKLYTGPKQSMHLLYPEIPLTAAQRPTSAAKTSYHRAAPQAGVPERLSEPSGTAIAHEEPSSARGHQLPEQQPRVGRTRPRRRPRRGAIHKPKRGTHSETIVIEAVPEPPARSTSNTLPPERIPALIHQQCQCRITDICHRR